MFPNLPYLIVVLDLKKLVSNEIPLNIIVATLGETLIGGYLLPNLIISTIISLALLALVSITLKIRLSMKLSPLL